MRGFHFSDMEGADKSISMSWGVKARRAQSEIDRLQANHNKKDKPSGLRTIRNSSKTAPKTPLTIPRAPPSHYLPETVRKPSTLQRAISTLSMPATLSMLTPELRSTPEPTEEEDQRLKEEEEAEEREVEQIMAQPEPALFIQEEEPHEPKERLPPKELHKLEERSAPKERLRLEQILVSKR